MFLIGDPNLISAVKLMKKSGMPDYEIAMVIQGVHAWATQQEFSRQENVVRQNPPKFPTMDEIQKQLINP